MYTVKEFQPIYAYNKKSVSTLVKETAKKSSLMGSYSTKAVAFKCTPSPN